MIENKVITVKNVEGEADTQTTIIYENNIDYIPKVSVIIPVYNTEKYLRKCLDSVVNQTLKEIEIICVDDGSTDSSLAILKEYAQKDNRIRVIESSCNKGAAVTRNKGLEITKGEYLSFVDSDDYVDIDFYEKLYTKAKEKDYDLVKCPRKRFEVNGEVSIGLLSEQIKKDGIYAFCYEWQSAIYKASLIKDNNIRFVPEIIKAQDIVFLNNVILKTKTYALIHNTFYNYQRRENSLHSKFLSKKKYKSAVLAIKTIINNINQSNLYCSSINDYNYLFLTRFHSLFYTYFQTKDKTMKSLLVQTLFELKNKCKDIEYLYANFYYKWLLKYLKNNDIKGLDKKMLDYTSFGDFNNNITCIKKLFLITNLQSKNNKWYKVIYILGLKFSFRNKKKENKIKL